VPETIDPAEAFQVTAFGDSARLDSSRELAQVIEARVEEILSLVMQEIKRSGYDGLLPAAWCCAAARRNCGHSRAGRRVLKLPVRVGGPGDLQASPMRSCRRRLPPASD